ncbi:hypothetical protein EDB85DRAFT_2288506 [Lactarius pseudohatsudake]|nr:hypothetical protein EDB85DRAFT_2288506 [Lactarius pseudohatsudake]
MTSERLALVLKLLKIYPIFFAIQTLPHLSTVFFHFTGSPIRSTSPDTMVDWKRPSTVVAEDIALVKLVHVLGGVYIWEIVSCLDFEYSFISKKRKFTWSFLLYLGCRWFPLFAIALQFLGFDVPHKINCQACSVFSFMFAYLSFMCTSALIILRIAVLWNHSKIIIAFICAVWIGNTAIYVYSLITLRSTWIGILCVILHTHHSRISVLSTLTTDIVLLVLMLAGLKRWKNAPKSGGVWRLLRTQGLTWVLIVTLVEVPPAVFISLDLNDAMNMTFQAFARKPAASKLRLLYLTGMYRTQVVISPLGAARLFRELIDYPTSNGVVKVVSGPHGEHSTPFSHKSHQTKKQHDSGGETIVLDILPVKTTDSEVPKGETFEGGNIV